MKPVILLTTGYYRAENGLSQRKLYQNYADAVLEAQGIALLALDGRDARELCACCDGLLLTGGVDADPARYGQSCLAACGEIDVRRDAEEWALLEAFCRAGKPVLGICRGIQLINVFFGGTLWQDLPSQCAIEGHADGGVHSVCFLEDSMLFSLFGKACQVNSYHHQAVRTPGSGLRVTARAEKVIEGLEHETLPLWAVQWHPERMAGPERFVSHGPDMAPLFERFVLSCRHTT